MIYSFKKSNGSGSGGTSNYNELSNKPQINGVTLSGNKTSQDLGIASESLEPVAAVPSGASVGDIYAISKSKTVGYGWEEITNGYAFNCSLNPASGDSYVEIGQLVGNGDSTSVLMYPDGSINCFGDDTKIGFTRSTEFDGGYVNINYYDYNRIEFTFEGIDVPTLQNAISSVSKTIVENKTVQVEATNVPLAHWEFWTQYQGRYQDIQFWLEQNGQKGLANTELGLFSYYQLYFKLYTNADGFFCVDYSNDSAVTWNHYIQNANIPVSEPEYYPIDITDPNGKQALFKAWFRSGDGNYGVIIKSNKYLWLDNYVTPNGVLTKNLIKEGDSYESLTSLPQINGVELKGNKSSAELGISDYLVLSNKPSINGVELDGNLTSDDLNLAVDKVKEVEPVTVLPTVAKDGSVFVYSQPETMFGWENIGYDASDNKFKAEFVFKQMPDVSEMPITLGTANVTGSLDETISQDLVLINDFFDGIMVQVGTENYMRKGQSSEFWYHGDNNLKCEYDWTNEDLLKFTIYESDTSQTKPGATITNQVDSAYVSINSLVQANGVDASGNTIYTKVGSDGMNIHWYTYSDGCFMYAREKCTTDGDYLIHQGAEIEGSRTVSGVRISGGTIIEAPYGTLNNIGDGHWAGSKEDTKGVIYFFHCWIEGKYLYWQTSSPIMNFDAYGTGSDLQGGLMYGGSNPVGESETKPERFTNLDLAAMSVGDTAQVVICMPDMEFGKQYLKTSSGATSGVSFGSSVDDFTKVIKDQSYIFTLTKEDTISSIGWEQFKLEPSDMTNFSALSWNMYDNTFPQGLSLTHSYMFHTLTFQMGKVKLIGSWVNSDHSTSYTKKFPEYHEGGNKLTVNGMRDGNIEFILYKVPTV